MTKEPVITDEFIKKMVKKELLSNKDKYDDGECANIPAMLAIVADIMDYYIENDSGISNIKEFNLVPPGIERSGKFFGYVEDHKLIFVDTTKLPKELLINTKDDISENQSKKYKTLISKYYKNDCILTGQYIMLKYNNIYTGPSFVVDKEQYIDILAALFFFNKQLFIKALDVQLKERNLYVGHAIKKCAEILVESYLIYNSSKKKDDMLLEYRNSNLFTDIESLTYNDEYNDGILGDNLHRIGRITTDTLNGLLAYVRNDNYDKRKLKKILGKKCYKYCIKQIENRCENNFRYKY